MYFTNIGNEELQYFHGLQAKNFTVSLTDMLDSDMFKVETVIADTLHRVYPLFYTRGISSTNPDDKILENGNIFHIYQ